MPISRPLQFGVYFATAEFDDGGPDGFPNYAVTAGVLPLGIHLVPATAWRNSGWGIAGVPTELGTFNYTVTYVPNPAVFNGDYTAPVSLVGGCPLVVVAPPSPLIAGPPGIPFSLLLSASVGVAPYTFDLVDGALPPGLSVSSAGLLAGTPTTLGVYTFAIRATDDNDCPGVTIYVMTVATGFIIGGSPGAAVRIQPFWSITESANNRNTFQFDLYSDDGSFRPSLDDEVLFYENGILIFGGNITTLGESGAGGLGVQPIVTGCSASDFTALTERVAVTTTIAAGTVKAALTALVTTLTAYGVTLDAAQVNGIALAALSYTDKSLKDIFDDIAKLAGNWVWEISYTKKLLMFQPSATAAPVNVIDGNGVALGDITVEPSRTNYANRIIVTFSANSSPTIAYGFLRCTTGNFANTETVTVGGKTYTFQTVLTNVDGNVLVGATSADSLNNLIAAITLAAGSGTLYAAATTINANVSATAGLTDDIATMRAQAIDAGAAGNAIAVSDTSAQGFWFSEGLVVITTLAHGSDGTALSNRVQADDVTDQNIGGVGANLKIRSIARPDLTSSDIAQGVADAELAASTASAANIVRYRTHTAGLHPGQIQTITNAWRNLSGTHLITEVVIRNTAGNRVERFVTTGGGTVLPRLWREVAAQMFGGGVVSGQAPPVGLPAIALSGDLTGSGAGSVPAILATVNGNVGSFGSASDAVVITVNAKGLVTAVSEVPIATGQGGRVTAQTAAVATVATTTVGAADSSVLVSANVNVTVSTLHSFSMQVDYTDETNTARTVTLTFSQLTAALVSVITNGTGAGPYEGLAIQIRCKAATAITAKTTGTFTSVTYNAEASFLQMA